MSERTLVKVTYTSAEAYLEHGTKVEDIIEKDTGRPVAQTKSIPPIIFPVELTPPAIGELKAIDGVTVEDVSKEY